MDTDDAGTGTAESGFKPVGKGWNDFESNQVVEGRVKWLDTPVSGSAVR